MQCSHNLIGATHSFVNRQHANALDGLRVGTLRAILYPNPIAF